MKKKLIVLGVAVIGLAALGLFVILNNERIVRQNALVVQQVEQEWQATRVEKMADIGTTHSLEILPLFEEAAARDDLEAEHGVSYLVKTDKLKLLLDVGLTPARLSHNMQALGISEKDFDAVLITHHHPDHVGGQKAWETNTVIAGDPPLDLHGKQVYVPMAMSAAGVEPVVTTAPTQLAQGVATIGTIAFADRFMDPVVWQRNVEQALAVNVEGKGIVLITGCGHPTLERLVARVHALFDEPIVGIVGGLHYEGMTHEQVQPHIDFVTALKPQLLAISPHDSSQEEIRWFRDALPNAFQAIQVGRVISFPENPQ